MIGDKLQKVTIIWLILSINITIGGFDLSDADLKSTLPAFGTLLVIISLVLFLMIKLWMAVTIHHYLLILLTWFALVMVLSFTWSILVNLLVRILNEPPE